jgi:hypothetical protein
MDSTRRILAAVMLASSVAMCGCASKQVVRDSPLPVTAPVAASTDRPQGISILGESLERRPIEMRMFCDADPASSRADVLIIGGIHGDEVTSVDVARELSALMAADATNRFGRRVAVIAVANPDGYARRSRYNARGIDINRNFPAKNFRPSRLRPARSRALSPKPQPSCGQSISRGRSSSSRFTRSPPGDNATTTTARPSTSHAR